MTIAGLTTSQTSELGLITGSGQTSSTENVNQVASTETSTSAQSTDSAKFSQGGQMMQQLKALQQSDPTKFKEAAQKISDELAEKAKSAGNSKEAKMYSDISSKFAEAAKTGEMPDMKPPAKPAGQGNGYGEPPSGQKMDGKGPGEIMSTMSSIFSSALQSVGVDTSSSSSSSSSTVGSTATVASVSSSAA